MWQRIQTLYMAISTILIVSMIFSIKAVIPGEGGVDVEGIRYTQYVPYLILMIVISFLNILALTTWKFRIFQMRTAVLSAIITLAFQVWLALDYFMTSDTMVFKFTAVFPLVAVILDLLAAKGIYSDQLMVESFSHLRSAKRKSRKR